jgi:predicted dehydrogenase
MEKKLRLVQIGAGGWGWSWIQFALDSPSWELAGVVIRRDEVKRQVCGYYGLDEKIVYKSVKDAVKHAEADAALVVVPPEAHLDVSLEVIEGGLHCLVEKPIAPTIGEAMRIVDAAKKSNLKLMVGQNYRFKRAPQTVKRLVMRGLIGKIGSAYVRFHKAPKFTGFRAEMAEPLIIDLSIHHFDQMRGILGLEPVSVLAHSWNPHWSYFKGNPVATLIFEMQGGAVCTYTGDWVTQGVQTTWDGDWYIHGDQGEIHWARNEVTARTLDVMSEVYFEGTREQDGVLRADLVDLPAQDRPYVLLEFANSILNDREPETSGEENLLTLSMVLAACRSLKEKRPVSMKEIVENR